MNEPQQASPQTISSWELTEKLEREAKRLEGVMRHHFIDQRSLCSGCKNANIIRQASQNSRVIRCSVFDKYMPEDITECSSYQAVGTLSLGQMADIAILLNDRAVRSGGYL